ncbi:LuxR family transcriptional regulator [Kouleothrix aurantiaca]|uniref:LuxR family transcriptional regulator n=1 Tax=Kouleothrix aurantiaca TaxID=186479 RepID=A0A0P9DXA2_9CHLR|nr:LuxR family transcriptional regulator [Kouleothrix aurantiaca]
MSIRVVIADDHNVVRKGIRDLLSDEDDIAVVGEARNGHEAVDLATALQPDVVVMDIAMPELSGVEATRQLRAQAPNVRVLVLTAYEDDPYIYSLLDAGATSYILKTAESREIVRAVRATAAGQTALDPAVAPRLIARITQPSSKGDTLTERELDVLRLAARGQTNKQIGAELAISDRTVQNHLANIYTKLGVASRTEAVTAGLQRNLIRLNE